MFVLEALTVVVVDGVIVCDGVVDVVGELVLVPDTVGVGVDELVATELEEEVPEPDGVMDGLAPRDKEAVGLAEREDDKVFEDEGVILGV